MAITLLGKPESINVRKVLWTCAELALDYEFEPWGAGYRTTDDPAFLALNPNGLVPVLREGELVLWESNTICRYLAGRAGDSALLPVEPAARASVEQWMDWQATELNTAWRYAFMGLVRNSPLHRDGASIAQSVAAWNRHMVILDARLARTGAYAAGDTFSLADVVLGLSTHRWFMAPIERPELPEVRRYYERLGERPGFVKHGRNGLP